VNKRIVNALQTSGVKSIGISGVDCGFLIAHECSLRARHRVVGQIDAIDMTIIDCVEKTASLPSWSPISRDAHGNIYNVNADLAASEIAKKCRAEHLLFVSDVPGVKNRQYGKKHNKNLGDRSAHSVRTNHRRYGAEGPRRRRGRIRWSQAGPHLRMERPGTLSNELGGSTMTGTVILK